MLRSAPVHGVKQPVIPGTPTPPGALPPRMGPRPSPPLTPIHSIPLIAQVEEKEGDSRSIAKGNAGSVTKNADKWCSKSRVRSGAQPRWIGSAPVAYREDIVDELETGFASRTA